MGPLHFYFDFISPFGYFASLRIEDIARHHGRTVDWHAMLLELKGLLSSEATRNWLEVDL